MILTASYSAFGLPPAGTIADVIALVRTQEDFIVSCAHERQIDPLTLRAQLLIQLPRLITDNYFPNRRDVQREVIATSYFVEESQHRYLSWLKPPEHTIGLNDLEFVVLEPEIAKIFHGNFHYVGSYRPGQHYAFVDRNSRRVVCMGSVASFDLQHVEEKIAPFLDPRSAIVWSRFFTFRWAPKDIFSHFSRKLCTQLVNDFGAQVLFSFINPNIGFNASSHKAAQFQLFAKEEGTNYMYLNGRYRTMRYFVDNYQLSDPRELKKKLGDAFIVSNMVLAPMLILARPLHHRAIKAIPAQPYLFHRPVLGDSAPASTKPRRRQIVPLVPMGDLICTYPSALNVASDMAAPIHTRLRKWQTSQLRSLTRVKEDEGQSIQSIARNFEAMRKDDVFVYVSSVQPYEMRNEDTALRPAIADALSRGATFVYARSKDECAQSAGAALDGQSEFETFADDVLSHLHPEEVAQARERLLLVQTEQLPVLDVPGSKWELFVTDDQEGQPGLLGGAEIITGPANNMNILMPQTAAMAKQMFLAVAREVREKGNAKSRVGENVVSNLTEKAQQLLLGAFDRSRQPTGENACTTSRDNQTSTSFDVLKRVKQRQDMQLRSLAVVKEDIGNMRTIAKNFESMGGGDIFVYVSGTTLPYEMRDDDTMLKPHIAHALSRGAVLVYVTPNDEWLRRAGERIDMQGEFKRFASRVLSHLHEDEAARLRDQLILVQAEYAPVFSVPGSKWDLFLTRSQRGDLCLRGGSVFKAGENGMNILIPQTPAMTQQLLYTVAREMCKPGVRQQSQLPSNVVVNLSDRTEKLTGRKIAI